MPTIEEVGTLRVDRLFRRVNITEGCWFWTGTLGNKDGYGVAKLHGRNYQVHRLVYELLVGPIPDGLVLDHVRERGCVSRTCVNPDHLEPVTQGENVRRTFPHGAGRCFYGHPLAGENLMTVHRSDGTTKRVCRICSRRRTNDHRRGRTLPIKNSKVKDARPAITAEAESEKGLFTANVSKGSLFLQRGTNSRQPSFALKYEEVRELNSLLTEIEDLLGKNQYDPAGSLEDGYEAGNARHTSTPRAGTVAQQAVSASDPTLTGQVPSESGVVSAATQGTGTPAGTENAIQPELASGAEAQTAKHLAETEDTTTDVPQVSQPQQTTTPSDDNPFLN